MKKKSLKLRKEVLLDLDLPVKFRDWLNSKRVLTETDVNYYTKQAKEQLMINKIEGHDIHGTKIEVGHFIVDPRYSWRAYLVVAESKGQYYIWGKLNVAIGDTSTIKNLKVAGARLLKCSSYRTVIIDPSIINEALRDKWLTFRVKILELYNNE